jgi:ATP-dependent DNA ligase
LAKAPSVRREELSQVPWKFVIGGFVPGSRGFYSLIVGVYEKKRLHFAAKVRNGFVPRIRDEIPPSQEADHRRLPLRESPRKKGLALGRDADCRKDEGVSVVEPVLVCQVAFVEWTNGDKLRHCTFVGMRDEKAAAKVVPEA